jgi:hypothetical protein
VTSVKIVTIAAASAPQPQLAETFQPCLVVMPGSSLRRCRTIYQPANIPVRNQGFWKSLQNMFKTCAFG